MIEAIVPIITIFWMVRIALNVFTYAEVWWVKEYRWDRMLIHLRTAQGKRFWWPQRRRPPISPKSILLVLFSFVFLGYVIWISELPFLLRLAIADLLSFPVMWILVLILNAPTNIYHKLLIAKANRKLRDHKPMMIIGITGSYGKTSIKDYLSTILSSKFKVLKTEASKNSPIGIAEVILKSLMPEHEVFVVEMGAYKIGEIAEMAAMVKPQIGIITAINEQHQDLFGSLENTMKAKYELIFGLTGKRIAVMNIHDERVQAMAHWAKRDGCDVWEGKFITSDEKAGFDGIEFTCIYGNEKATVKVPVIGAHQINNILLAVSGAMAAGMTFKDAADAARGIRPNPKSLCILPGINESIYINDTFNNNPDSAKAALDVLQWGNRKKFLVFQPMIELGKYAAESHTTVGAYAAKICDHIILTNRNFHEDLIKGVRGVSKEMRVSVLSPEKAAETLRNEVRKGDTVLFKGKEAERVLRAL